MSHDRISDDIRTQLEFYPTELDTDRLWRKIGERKVVENRSNRVVLVMFSLVVFGFLGLSYFGFFNKVNKNDLNQNAIVSHEKVKDEQNNKIDSQKTDNEYVIEEVKGGDNEVFYSKSTQLDGHEKRSSKLKIHQATKNYLLKNTKLVSKEKSPKYLNKESNQKMGQSPQQLIEIPTSKGEISLSKLPHKKYYLGLNSKTISAPTKVKYHKNRPKITLLFSPDFASKKITQITPEYSDLRRETESILNAFSTEILYSLPYKKGFEITTGLSYQRINEKFLWTNESSGIIKKEDGKFYLQNLERVKTHYNKIEFIDVPILIGYDRNTKGLLVGLHAGVYFNIQTKVSGEILSPDLESNSFLNLSVSPFKKRIGMSPAIHLRLGYQYRKWTLLVEPGFKKQLQSITESGSDFNQKYDFWRVRLGLRRLLY